jgi:hypothetical protein
VETDQPEVAGAVVANERAARLNEQAVPIEWRVFIDSSERRVASIAGLQQGNDGRCDPSF